MDGILQHVLTTIRQQHLLFGNTVNLTDTYTNHTLFALIVYAGVEAKILWIEVLHSINNLLTRLKIEFVSIKIIHFLLYFVTLQPAKVRISEQKTKGKPVFLCFFERKCLRACSKVRISEQKTKRNIFFLLFLLIHLLNWIKKCTFAT